MTAHPWLAVPVRVALYVVLFEALDLVLRREGSFGDRLLYAIAIAVGLTVSNQSRRTSRRPPRDLPDNKTRPISIRALRLILLGGLLALAALLGLTVWAAR